MDVQIAVDQVRGAIKNEYDKCFLISSDTDLLPAIQTAKDEKKEIVYVGFENFISRALQKNCSSSLILKKDQILKFTKVKKRLMYLTMHFLSQMCKQIRSLGHQIGIN